MQVYLGNALLEVGVKSATTNSEGVTNVVCEMFRCLNCFVGTTYSGVVGIRLINTTEVSESLYGTPTFLSSRTGIERQLNKSTFSNQPGWSWIGSNSFAIEDINMASPNVIFEQGTTILKADKIQFITTAPVPTTVAVMLVGEVFMNKQIETSGQGIPLQSVSGGILDAEPYLLLRYQNLHSLGSLLVMSLDRVEYQINSNPQAMGSYVANYVIPGNIVDSIRTQLNYLYQGRKLELILSFQGGAKLVYQLIGL